MTRRALREHLVRLLYMREFHEADELEEQISSILMLFCQMKMQNARSGTRF